VTSDQITKAMLLANVLAVARVKRYAANTRNGGATALMRADEDVNEAAIALRTYLETFQCPEPSSVLSTSFTN
jgi:hypothetical protein